MSRLQIKPTGRRGKPLCLLKDGLLAGYRGRLVLYRAGESEPVRSFPLPIGGWKAVCSRSRTVERLLHTEVRWAVPLGDEECVFACSSGIWRLNVSDASMEREEVPVRGKPLSAAVLPCGSGAAPELLIGDYGSNPEREPVRVFRRDGNTGRWSCVFSFSRGAVRHIHGIVPDERRRCIYILTGDEDSESGIWTAPEDLSAVTPLFTGSQEARACQLLPAENRLYYLTDSPSQVNHLMALSDGKASRLEELNGSVIYGTRLGDSLLFSTTVEPEAHAPNRLSYFLTNRIGSGIRDTRVMIGCLHPDGSIEYAAGYIHDRLPLRLFQYGAASFCAAGPESAFFAPCCVRNADQLIYHVSIE